MAPGNSTHIVCSMGLGAPSQTGTSTTETIPSKGARRIYSLTPLTGLWTYGLACQSFLFANETDSNTIMCNAYMARSIAMTTDTCRQPGDGDSFRAQAITHKLTGNA